MEEVKRGRYMVRQDDFGRIVTFCDGKAICTAKCARRFTKGELARMFLPKEESDEDRADGRADR